jgi:hypothetical protein
MNEVEVQTHTGSCGSQVMFPRRQEIVILTVLIHPPFGFGMAGVAQSIEAA